MIGEITIKKERLRGVIDTRCNNKKIPPRIRHAEHSEREKLINNENMWRISSTGSVYHEDTRIGELECPEKIRRKLIDYWKKR